MSDTVVIPPEEMQTEQEKDTSSEVKGVGPATPAEHTTGPVETIEDLGIGPREPYPTTDAPPPEADAEKARDYTPPPPFPTVTPGPATDPFGNPKGKK